MKYTTLLNGKVKLRQSMDGLRASMDSVLLASAVTVNPKDHVLDMGCGTGAVGLCVCARNPNIQLNGIDIQSQMIDLAKQNADENGLIECHYVCANVADKNIFDAESFDHIVMNPPYYKQGERQASPDSARETAYSGDLEIWMKSALYWVRQGGALTIIHRADKLDEILTLSHRKFGAIEVWPIHSKVNEPAIRVIVKMIRNRKTPLVLHPPIALFNEDGIESARSKSLLRDGVGLV